MNKLIKIAPLVMALMLSACEDKDTDNNKAETPQEVTTTNVNDGAFYYNLEEKKQNQSAYHIAYQNVDAGQGFSMPSFSLSNSVMLAIDSASDFESIEVAPARDQFAPESGRIQYGGANAVLTYNMVTHQVGVSNDTYIIYDTITHRVYKVKFDDYSGGVVIFRFMELSLY